MCPESTCDILGKLEVSQDQDLYAICLNFKCHTIRNIICAIFLTPTAAVTAKILDTSNFRDLIGNEGTVLRNNISPCKKQRKGMFLFSVHY